MTIAAPTESVVTLTESAAGEIRRMVSAGKENEGKFLRVFVEAGGCSGMQYGMVFDEKREGDLCSEFHGVTVLVDAVSSEYLRGAKVDFVDALTGGGFKISNPRAKQSCGCGKSFET